VDKNNTSVQKKFEFDLFSLSPEKFARLEQYVQECMTINQIKESSLERKT
jgi:hypothetical protein